MSQPLWVQVASNLEVYVGCFFGLAIALVYGVTARWWETPAGRCIIGLAVSLGGLLLHISLFRWTGDYPGRVYVGLGLFTLLVAILGALFVMLWRVQVWPKLRLWLGFRRRKR